MLSNTLKFVFTTTILALSTLLLVQECNGKPWPQNGNPLEQSTLLEPGRMSCPEESKNLCQRCAKQTKSPVVYPWCCTNYEATREWCTEYLEFGE